MFRNLLNNQKGNSVAIVMVAMGILGGTSYTIMRQMNTVKKSIKVIQVNQQRKVFEKRIKAYLSDINTCITNFQGQSPTATYDQLIRNGEPVFEKDKVYSNGTIKVLRMWTEAVDADQMNFFIEYEKIKAGNLGSSSIQKSFSVSHVLNDVGTRIEECYLDDNGEITTLYNEALANICNGPGAIDTNPDPDIVDCQITTLNLVIDCPAGQAIGDYTFNPDTNSIESVCENIVSDTGNAGLECPYGLKFTAIPGEYQCFTLDELVDTTPTLVTPGSECNIEMDNGRMKFNCIAPGVDALCGGANGNSYNGADAVNAAGLCNPGTAPAVSGTGPWSWTCTGTTGADSPQCNATVSTPTPFVCGTANGSVSCTAMPDQSGACESGLRNNESGSGPWNWQCGDGGAGDPNCSCSDGGPPPPLDYVWVRTPSGDFCQATGSVEVETFAEGATPAGVECFAPGEKSYVPTTNGCGLGNHDYDEYTCNGTNDPNGLCGNADGGRYSLPPPANILCDSGYYSELSGSGPWSWTCTGTSTTANCATAPGVCGSADRTECSAQPLLNTLCSIGEPSPLSGNYEWTCGPAGNTTDCSCSPPIGGTGLGDGTLCNQILLTGTDSNGVNACGECANPPSSTLYGFFCDGSTYIKCGPNQDASCSSNGVICQGGCGDL